MKQSYILAAFVAVSFLTACGEKEDAKPSPDMTVELTAVVDGAQQADAKGPAPVTTSATGTFTGTYTKVGTVQKLNYTIVYQGLTPTIAHIHTGAPGTAGAVAIPFTNLASPITGTFTLSPEQAENLLNNRMYVNIHTAAYGGGEIRGDIKKK
ncbi:MAG TPA: CHRD domain-containing protein [Hymenobacter sp.]|jgi:hypothetical protein